MTTNSIRHLLVTSLLAFAVSSSVVAQHGGYQLWRNQGALSGASILAVVGDLNHDGYPDVLTGGGGGPTADLLSGLDGTSLGSFAGATSSIRSAAALGDLDNDGYPEFILGAPVERVGGVQVGQARVFSGRTQTVLYAFSGTTLQDDFGVSVADAGDVNADGVGDILVGAGQAYSSTGYAKVFSGRDGTVLHTLTGVVSNGSGYAWSCAGVGDADADGFDDIAIGAFAIGGGRVFLYSGRLGTLLWTASSLGPYDSFGAALSIIGDVNGDGLADVLVGAHQVNAGNGYAQVLSGLDGAIVHHVAGTGRNDLFGWSVRGGVDLDGDGTSDFMVGAPHHMPLSTAADGYVSVFSGSNATLLGQVAGTVTNGSLGTSVEWGRLDADPYPDIVASGWLPVHTVAAFSLIPPPLISLGGSPAVGSSVSIDIESLGDPNIVYLCGLSGGSSPGLRLADTRVIPLNGDSLLSATLSPNQVLTNSIGVLDGGGRSSLYLHIPSDPVLRGAMVYTAFITVDLSANSLVRRISAALPIVIQ
ncbi:MAG: VCBS repeat-containing protein [Planctomycetes bacterium]|nr:VCBS repeat-containing protein [Planctomycetota bacterium]